MTPSPSLLQKLARSRLLVRHAAARLGVGDRRSAAKGAGIEFADHRAYQPGDDVRHLDLHLQARLGEYFIRQYAVYQQLRIAILVDGSASMASGQKFEVACLLAAALGFVGLAGGDRVEAGVFAGDRLAWSPRLHGADRARLLFDWLEAQAPRGQASFDHAIHQALPHLQPGGLLILISDWWLGDPAFDLRILSTAGQELLGAGEVRLVDAESGHEVELALEPATRARYEAAFAAWREHLRRQFARHHGRYLLVRTDADLERLLLQDWRRAAIIG